MAFKWLERWFNIRAKRTYIGDLNEFITVDDMQVGDEFWITDYNGGLLSKHMWDGVAWGIKEIGGGTGYYAQVSLGQVPGTSRVYKFGAVVTTTGKRTPATDLNTNYVFPTTANTLTVTSDNAADVNQGAGAWSVTIEGLNLAREEISETVLIGATTLQEFYRVNRAFVWETGTGVFPYDITQVGNNVGTITITHNGTAAPIAAIQPMNGQTLMAIFSVPKGKRALVWAADATNGKQNQAATAWLYLKDDTRANAPWLMKGTRNMYRNTVQKTWRMPSVMPAGHDLVFAVEGQTGDPVSATFEMELQDI